MEYSIIRSKKRKRYLEFRIVNNKIVAYTPEKMDVATISKFYEKHRDVLQSKINKENNDFVEYLGEKYKINVVKSKLLRSSHCEINGDDFNIFTPDKDVDIMDIINQWKKQRAGEIIPKRIEIYLNKYKFQFNFEKNNIKYKNQKTRWGSCSYNNNLNFNYNVISKSIEVIDYLVVHELTHTIIKNHSQKFWNVLKTIIPDFDILRKQLK